jgi:RNA polymerase sigma-32 factor
MSKNLKSLHSVSHECIEETDLDFVDRDSIESDIDEFNLHEKNEYIISVKTEGQHYLEYPYLSFEKEQELAKIYHEYQQRTQQNDNPNEKDRRKAMDSAHQLVMAHMRYVVKLARQYANYGLATNDLIQEGAIGLMKAVQHFDPYKGVRLISFAMHWIKSEINNYVVRNWRMVKIATTKAQRKLFFNFRRLKEDNGTKETSAIANQRIAKVLDLPLNDVEHMALRFADGESHLDAVAGDGSGVSLADLIPSLEQTPEQGLIERNHQNVLKTALKKSLIALNERDQEIIQARFFSDEAMTLKVLAEKFGISVERVRQIEKKALESLRMSLEPLGC